MKNLYSALFSTLVALGLIALPFSASLFGKSQSEATAEHTMHEDVMEEGDMMGDTHQDEEMVTDKEEDKNAKEKENINGSSEETENPKRPAPAVTRGMPDVVPRHTT